MGFTFAPACFGKAVYVNRTGAQFCSSFNDLTLPYSTDIRVDEINFSDATLNRDRERRHSIVTEKGDTQS